MKKTLITLAALAMASVAQAADAEIPWGNVTYNAAAPTGEVFNNFSSASGAYTMVLVLDWNTAVDWTNAEEETPGSPSSGLGIWSSPTSVRLGGGGSGEAYYWNHYLNIFQGADENSGKLCVTITKDGTGVSNSLSFSQPSEGESIDVITGSNYASFTMDEYAVEGKLALALTASENGGNTIFTLSALKANLDTQGEEYTLATLTADSEWDVNQLTRFQVINNSAGLVEHLVMFNTSLTPDEVIAVTSAIVPEPATATLSLLALAGLAARRRRK